jgi:FkbM family methyltransferase
LDLGANVGLAAACFRELFPQALICCVEPEQENFEVLKINAELLGNVSTVQGFVGGEPGTGYVRKPDTGGEWGFFLSREAGLGSCQTARVWTVSELLRELGWDGVDLVKSDIEGSEVEVFADCGEWLPRVRALIVETHSSDFAKRLPRLLQGFQEVWRQDLGRTAVWAFARTADIN